MSSVARTRVVSAIIAALCAGAAPAFGQQVSSKPGMAAPPAVVIGKITGPDKKGLAEVEVLLGDTNRTFTDKKGRFEFDPVAAGMHEVLVRKIGFTPVQFRLAVTAGDIWDGTISLDRTAQALPEVVVLDSSKALKNFRPHWIDDFLTRRRAGFGTFLDRVDIENAMETNTAKLLMRTAGIMVYPGVGYDELRVNRCGSGSGTYKKGIVYVDGMKAEESRNGRFVTFRDFPVEYLAAIEIYKGRSGVPIEFDDPSACLTVLLWTKMR
ncbi:MAG TPA: carboxypeptidase regulatory-like domain-containing protein [Gemmatimonadaceae bacterium]